MNYSSDFVSQVKSSIALAIENDNYTVGYPCYDEKEILACLNALLELRLSQGKYVKKFENDFLSYLNCSSDSYALAVNSGSSANLVLFATLLAAGKLSIGDKVLVPASTFATVASPLYQLGLVPVYVDVNIASFCMSSIHLNDAISKFPDIKACMIVHNLGFCEDIDKISDICNEKNILLIEDCCEAHGGTYKNKKLGTYGHYSTWSFFVAHNITTGEGGMIISNQNDHEDIMRSIREFGRRTTAVERYEEPSTGKLGEYDTRYIFDRVGYNVRMSDYAASMGSVQVSKLDNLNKDRLSNAKKLTSMFNKYSDYFSICEPIKDCIPAYYGFPVLVKSQFAFRNELCAYLGKNKIETRPNMGGCLPNQPAFTNLQHFIHGDLNSSLLITTNAFFLGVHSGLTDSHFQRLDEALSDFLRSIE